MKTEKIEQALMLVEQYADLRGGQKAAEMRQVIELAEVELAVIKAADAANQ